MIGDAPHAPTLWQGSGAGMSIEDSLALSPLFGATRPLPAARVAWHVYKSALRALAWRVFESSKRNGRIAVDQDSETSLNAATFRDNLQHLWDFDSIWMLKSSGRKSNLHRVPMGTLYLVKIGRFCSQLRSSTERLQSFF